MEEKRKILCPSILNLAIDHIREEIEKLEAYLVGEQEMILQEAKGVNPIRNLFT